MTTAVATANTALAAMPRDEVIHTLQNSLYPGATRASVELVLSYCAARGLDPMRKPVHIVPMWDKATRSTRDVIMPGIGQYRIDAARTKEYAGQDEPEFGPTDVLTFGESRVEYPTWCKVTVYRIVNGVRVPFSSVERWIENYQTREKGSTAPNAMWARRPFAQLAKCAEAQALRKAFPEEIGAEPTADEGRYIEVDDVPAAPAGNEFAPKAKAEPKTVEAEPADAPAPEKAPAAPIDVNPETGEITFKPATPGMRAAVTRALAANGKTEADLSAVLGFTLATMPFDAVNRALDFAKAK